VQCFLFVIQVAEDKLSTLDSLSRLGHYVIILDSDWSTVVKDATELRNDIDETLEVLIVMQSILQWFASDLRRFAMKYEVGY